MFHIYFFLGLIDFYDEKCSEFGYNRSVPHWQIPDTKINAKSNTKKIKLN